MWCHFLVIDDAFVGPKQQLLLRIANMIMWYDSWCKWENDSCLKSCNMKNLIYHFFYSRFKDTTHSLHTLSSSSIHCKWYFKIDPLHIHLCIGNCWQCNRDEIIHSSTKPTWYTLCCWSCRGRCVVFILSTVRKHDWYHLWSQTLALREGRVLSDHTMAEFSTSRFSVAVGCYFPREIKVSDSLLPLLSTYPII